MAGVEAASRSNNKHQSRRGGSDVERRSKNFFMPDKEYVGPWMEPITVALRACNLDLLCGGAFHHDSKFLGRARTRGRNSYAKHHHSLLISYGTTRIAWRIQRNYRRMVRASRFGAQGNQLLVKIALLRIRIAGERNGQQEIRIRRDAHMIAVLRQQLIKIGKASGRERV